MYKRQVYRFGGDEFIVFIPGDRHDTAEKYIKRVYEDVYKRQFVGSELTGGEDEKDSIIRFPLRRLWRRPVFAREKECRKLKGNKDD